MKLEQGRVQVLAAVPGAARMRALVSSFVKGGHGIVTAFSDDFLVSLRTSIEYEGIEFLTFGEAVGRFAVTAGCERLPIAPASLMAEALVSACSELPEGAPFRTAGRFFGVRSATWRTLQELHEACIVIESVSSMCNGPLASKLGSLARLDAALSGRLDQLRRTTVPKMMRDCLEVAQCEAKLDRLLVFGGHDSSALKIKWLEWAASSGSSVRLVLDRHAGHEYLFSNSTTGAKRLGVEPERVGEGNGLLEGLFATDPVEPDGEIRVTTLKAADRIAECEWVLRLCLEEMDSERGIFVRDIEAYAPLLEAASKQLGVPLRLTRRAPLLSNRFARLIQDLLVSCAGREIRPLRTLLGSSYLQLSLGDRQRADEAIRVACRAGDQQWQILEHWTAAAGENFVWFGRLLSWRKQALATPCSLREWTNRLREIAEALPSHLFGGGPLAGRDARAQSAMRRPLAQIASLEAERYGRIDLVEFATLCKRLWADSDVSIPPSSEGIPVWVKPESVGTVDTLFVLGMLEGIFPRRRTEDPILFDSERAQISELAEGAWLENSHDQAKAERDALYRVCAAARSRLVLSFPETDDQQDNIPASYLVEVERAAGVVDRLEPSRTALTPPMGQCISERDLTLAAALAGDLQQTLPENRLESEEARLAVGWSKDRPLSPRELSEAVRCPFRFFAGRQLGIRPQRAASRWNSLRKLPQTVGLSLQPTEEAAEFALFAALNLAIDEILAEAAPWEISLLRSGGQRLAKEWVHREFAARKLWPRSDVRLSVGFGEAPLHAKVAKADVTLVGRVPACSTAGPYRISHLYESREIDWKRDKPIDDADFIYFGLHLLAQYERGQGSALEVETMAGNRVLYLLPRLPGTRFEGLSSERLKVIDLGDHPSFSESVRDFFEYLMTRTKAAAAVIRSLEVDARPGDACAWCDYGELCRRSREFSEEESPFDAKF